MRRAVDIDILNKVEAIANGDFYEAYKSLLNIFLIRQIYCQLLLETGIGPLDKEALNQYNEEIKKVLYL